MVQSKPSHAPVAELVDALGLGSSINRCEGSSPFWCIMQFLQYTDILAGKISDEPFAELEEYAYAAIEKRESLGDNPYASGREEWVCEIPPKFEMWLGAIINTMCKLHTEDAGWYGVDHSMFRIEKMWVNVMSKGDQHFPHTHNKSLYSFAAYIDVNDGDAPFYFIKDNQGTPIDIDSRSKGMIMIFPSTMIHTVYPQQTDNLRISVSGNIGIHFDR
tara:strand:- start:977 stop:1627 length:651 start_codon:yes stop_codon:yes gene_type:complete